MYNLAGEDHVGVTSMEDFTPRGTQCSRRNQLVSTQGFWIICSPDQEFSTLAQELASSHSASRQVSLCTDIYYWCQALLKARLDTVPGIAHCPPSFVATQISAHSQAMF